MAKLIIALDCAFPQALDVIDATQEFCDWYKIGLRSIYSDGQALLPRLRGKQLMLDAKLMDTPDTVAAATGVIIEKWRPDLLTVYGSAAAAAAAVSSASRTRVLCVPRLTADPGRRSRAFYDTYASNCNGFVCPVKDALAAREALLAVGKVPIIVCAGIRFLDDNANDHATAAAPTAAAAAGADYIVVGRPIITASDPGVAARRYQEAAKLSSDSFLEN